MKLRTSTYVVAVCLVSAKAGLAYAGPTGQEILKKVSLAQKSMQTYQAIMTVNSSSKSLGSMILRIDFKSVPGKKYSAKTVVVGTPTGQFAMVGSFANATVVDDGKDLWTYNTGMKTYNRKASIITLGQSFNMTDTLAQQKPENITVMGETKLGGKSAYAVRVADPKDKRKDQPTMTAYIDRINYRVLRTEIALRQPGVGGKGTESMNIIMNVESEKINLPIPESAFKFVPPPGAKEVVGGFGAGMMGMPGMQGGKNKGAKTP